MVLLYFLKLALYYILSLVFYDIFADFFFFFFIMQKVSYWDFFEWADKKISTYEKRLARHLKEIERRRQLRN